MTNIMKTRKIRIKKNRKTRIKGGMQAAAQALVRTIDQATGMDVKRAENEKK